MVLNYAVNKEKAVRLAAALLAPDGRLLAPANNMQDYYFGQTYLLLGECRAHLDHGACSVGIRAAQGGAALQRIG